MTDFGAYPDWNPFIRRISGELREGARLEVRIEPPGARAMTFKPTVRSVEANRELRWLGRLLLPGVFDGEHSLRIEATRRRAKPFRPVGALQRLPRRAFQGHARKDRGRVRADERRTQGAGRAGVRPELVARRAGHAPPGGPSGGGPFSSNPLTVPRPNLVAALAVVVGSGDEVYALTPFDRDGVAAEYAVVPADVLAPKPLRLSHVEAAARDQAPSPSRSRGG